MAPYSCSFNAMGTSWKVTVWDDIPETTFLALEQTIRAYCSIFDHTYSRFIATSFIVQHANRLGVYEVNPEFVEILQLYKEMFVLSEGVFSPLVGDTLSDLGYDATYSLKRKEKIRRVPDFLTAVKIIDERHIELKEKTTIDIGAIGKGFAVDAIAHILEQKNVHSYLVDGSGDIRYKGTAPTPIGLEDPHDPKKIIGLLEFPTGAMCSSAINRRTWQGMHHIIDPHTNKPADSIIASWVIADSAAVADGLSTALFLCPPEQFVKKFRFDYLLLNKDRKVKRSKGFTAELY